MLIPSHRHRASDLDLWREHEAADMVHGATRLAEKVARSVDAIREFAATDDAYCGVSWGKDSVVVAWLVLQVAPHVPLIWVRPAGAECPGCEEVRDAFLRRFPCTYFEPECPAKIWNDPTVSNETAFRPAVDASGTMRRITGVRANESGARKISMRFHGLATENSCRPIGWWDEADVFALHAIEQLPTHPNYAMLGGGRWERRRLRVASLGGEWGTQFGRREWELEYYGDIIRRLEARQ